MARSWVNGCLHNLKMPSVYRLFARVRNWSCWSVANIKWRRPRTLTSERKKPLGMWLSSNSKSRSSGSFGHSCWRFLLAARAIYYSLSILEYGLSRLHLVQQNFLDDSRGWSEYICCGFGLNCCFYGGTYCCSRVCWVVVGVG